MNGFVVVLLEMEMEMRKESGGMHDEVGSGGTVAGFGD